MKNALLTKMMIALLLSTSKIVHTERSMVGSAGIEPAIFAM